MKLSNSELRKHLAEVEAAIGEAENDDVRAALQRERDETRRALLATRGGRSLEDGSGTFEVRGSRSTKRDRNPSRDEALRAIEQLGVTPEAGDRLVELVEKRDRTGRDARYIVAVSDEHYERAFAKMLADPAHGHLRFTPEEVAAVQRVTASQAERAINVGTDSAGGFAVPASLDPTINLTSDGDVNPIRALASKALISTDEHQAITSAGITAAFSAEAAQASDDSPTLGQVSIKPERMLMFVPVSFEAFGDWGALSSELGRLFADAKDNLEAEKFANGAGSGSDEPEGLIAGLAASSLVDSTAYNAFADDDVYALQAALGPRFQPRASWISSNAVANVIYRFAGGGSTEPPLFNDARDRILGKPWKECSTMSATVAASEKVLLYADIAAAYRVVDRVGLTVEIAPVLFGANQRPTGQRGFVAWARVGGGILNDAAARLLRVEPSS